MRTYEGSGFGGQNGVIVIARQAGLSLVELMVAMLLGVLLTLGVTQIFFGSSVSYQMNEGVARIQESARFAADFLQREVRTSGQLGCSQNILNWLDPGVPAYLPHIHSGENAIIGWEFPGTGLGEAYPIVTLAPGGAGWNNGTGEGVPGPLAGQVIPGNDILVVNRADPINAVPTAVAGTTITTNPAVPPNVPQWAMVIAVLGNCSGADMFMKTNATGSAGIIKNVAGVPGNRAFAALPGFSNLHTNTSTLYLYTSTAYYVGRGLNGEPGLFRRRLDPVGGVAEEVIDGVENMQVLYGLRVGAQRQPARYVTASNVNDWTRVVSVRIGLLTRTELEVADAPANVAAYNLIGTAVSPMVDRRLRLASTTTSGIRSALD